LTGDDVIAVQFSQPSIVKSASSAQRLEVPSALTENANTAMKKNSD